MLSTYGESSILLAKGSLGVVTRLLTLLFYTFSSLFSQTNGGMSYLLSSKSVGN